MTKQSHMTTPDQDCLDWLAFCYAAGELNAAESDDFEDRLAKDQDAREALARAVELTQTVAAAESQPLVVMPAAVASGRWQSRVAWMAIGGVASLLIGLLWSGVVGPTWKSARQLAGTEHHERLATAWTQTRQEMTGTSEVWSDYEAALAWEAEFPFEALGGGIAAEQEVEESPSWMMAAVYARSQPAAATDRESNQRLEN
jgi:hypothetical protein